MASRRTLTLGVAVAGVLAALLAAGYWTLYADPPQSTERLADAPKGPPQLYCMFIRFTGEPRLELLFNIGHAGGELQFEQVYLAEFSGRDKTLKQPPFAKWRFDAGAEPARLESEISVFDTSAAGSHSETITIELYAYRPEQGNSAWIESGLKNIYYQNLSGKCQQTRPVPLVSTSN
jgi:hypothetical protein